MLTGEAHHQQRWCARIFQWHVTAMAKTIPHTQSLPPHKQGGGGTRWAQRVPKHQCPQPKLIAQMVQEGVNLVFVIKVPRAAAVVESNTLLPPPPPPTGPLQQHGHDM
jgi:hypothetical protein